MKHTGKHLFQITAPHFCAGFESQTGFENQEWRVSQAAPILAWTLGMKVLDLTLYCSSRAWQLRHVKTL